MLMNKLDHAVVDFANDAFYLAFNHRDIAEMERLWAETAPVVCIHPGWQPLTDRAEIIDSWQRIFENQGDQQIICHPFKTLLQGDVYSVLCYEQLGQSWFIATNNFLVESGEVRLIHHQAGQCMDPPDIETPLQTFQ